jgi:ABC-2 type transport system ATP-binding protein
MDAIVVDALHKRYGSLTAVDSVSFVVEQGETFGILGPNGAGKTTTLEMIEGLTEPDGGTVAILGDPVWPHPERVQRRIGVQLQSTALFDLLTTREILELFCRFYELEPGDRPDRVLATVGLSEKAGSRVTELSGGQKQRVAIALALVHDPELVFLDEPTTGLDPQARRALWDVIEAIGAEGRTVVLTTHYLEEAETLCRRVAIMDGGRIVALDTPAGLVRSLGMQARVAFGGDGLDERLLGTLPGVTATAGNGDRHELESDDPQATVLSLVEAADAQGVTLQDLSIRTPTLEDVFLQLTGRELRE